MKILVTSVLSLILISCVNRKAEILKQLKYEGYPDKEVAVTLEAFFDGNTVIGSIGPNLSPSIQPSKFYAVFKKISLSRKTEAVFVRISDSDDTDWFYTDAVYIIGDWTKEELSDELKELQPDEIYEGYIYSKPVNVPNTKNRIFTLWWD
jgi:hypothetical protein